MYTGSEDGAIKIWDLRAPSCERNYNVGSAVNTVALHPNQAELISGDMDGKIKVCVCVEDMTMHDLIGWEIEPSMSIGRAFCYSTAARSRKQVFCFVQGHVSCHKRPPPARASQHRKNYTCSPRPPRLPKNK